jgi:hypothetical protein
MTLLTVCLLCLFFYPEDGVHSSDMSVNSVGVYVLPVVGYLTMLNNIEWHNDCE